MYNLNLFGEKLRELRVSKKFSQEKVSELSLIDVKTISKIENGKVIPKLETLEILSEIYNMDLVDLLKKYRLDDFDLYENIKNTIIYKVDNRLFNDLNSDIDNLNSLLESFENKYLKIRFKQLLFFVQSIVYIEENQLFKAKEVLLNGLKLSIKDFDISKFSSYFYNSSDIELLMNLARVYLKCDSFDLYYCILCFCFKYINNNDPLYSKICINFGNANKTKADFKTALEIFQSGIYAAIESNHYNKLDLLYYGLGTCEANLNISTYKNSFKTALSFSKATKRHNVSNLLMKNMKKYYDFNISLDDI